MDEQENIPLAARQAPKKLEDFAGQPHLLGPGKMLRRLLEADTRSSVSMARLAAAKPPPRATSLRVRKLTPWN